MDFNTVIRVARIAVTPGDPEEPCLRFSQKHDAAQWARMELFHKTVGTTMT
jgi:hypothetical protein